MGMGPPPGFPGQPMMGQPPMPGGIGMPSPIYGGPPPYQMPQNF